jgi:hypothetical protein
VLRLDNRPRRVAVSGVSLHSERDEALRQHLMVSYFANVKEDSGKNANYSTFLGCWRLRIYRVEPRPI